MEEEDYFAKARRSPHLWLELVSQIVKIESELPETEWHLTLPALPPGVEARERARQFQWDVMAQMEPHADGALDMLIGILQDHDPQGRTPAEVFYLRVMLREIRSFIGGMVVRRSPRDVSTIFPFPNVEVYEVLLWLATEWWPNHGLTEYAIESSMMHQEAPPDFEFGDN